MVGVEAVQNIRWGHSTFSLPRENEKWHRLTLYCENLNKGGGGRISPETRLTANLYFFPFYPFLRNLAQRGLLVLARVGQWEGGGQKSALNQTGFLQFTLASGSHPRIPNPPNEKSSPPPRLIAFSVLRHLPCSCVFILPTHQMTSELPTYYPRHVNMLIIAGPRSGSYRKI